MAKKKKKTESKRLPKLAGNFPSLGEKREATFPIDELAKRARVSQSALAGMKAAYRWDSQTKLSEAEFTEKARSWLNAGGR